MKAIRLNSDHPNIQNRDWRLQAITTLAENWQSPNGVLHKAGEPVESIGLIKYPGRNPFLLIPMPNASAMYFSLSLKAKSEGQALLNKLDKLVIDKQTASIPYDQDGLLYDCLENLIACIVFSYTVLETFANDSIKDDFQFVRPRQDKRYTEVYSKEQIERNVSLDTKFHEILPGIFSVKSPKGTSQWEDFLWLKELRDRFIHLKSADWNARYRETPVIDIWNDLLSTKTMEAPGIAISIIDYFYQGTNEKPRWLKMAIQSGITKRN